MISDNMKIKVWIGMFFIWGVLTGRCLPQWEDMANSWLWFGDVLMYWIMIIFGLVVLYFQPKIDKLQQVDKKRK